ncbi:MAG: hypothetical protein DWQ40_04415 [Actinobacteria bacterium]|nr:MAG: hypothetical protein DWQ40_04415 [Actinomycetota bacterium]
MRFVYSDWKARHSREPNSGLQVPRLWEGTRCGMKGRENRRTTTQLHEQNDEDWPQRKRVSAPRDE